jgi:hypothetical protein
MNHVDLQEALVFHLADAFHPKIPTNFFARNP